jgi:hypothetical protein
MTDIGQRVMRDLRDRLFRHILDQSATFFSQHTSGQLMSRITNDVNPGPASRIGDRRRSMREDCRWWAWRATCSTWTRAWRWWPSPARRSSCIPDSVRQERIRSTTGEARNISSISRT